MRGDVLLPWPSKMDTYTLQLRQCSRSMDQYPPTSASSVPGIDRSPSCFLEYGFWTFSDSKSPTVEDSNRENPRGVEITILTDFINHSSFRRRLWTQMEQTFIMIKPDGVQRGLVGEIIKRFEAKGYFLRGLKMTTVDKTFAETHYKDLADKPFFPPLIEYITSGPVVAMVWEGQDAARQGRKMLGKTNPLDSDPGTIRGDFSLIMGRNIIHGSDSVDSAKAEIALWFPEGLNEYEHHSKPWIYE